MLSSMRRIYFAAAMFDCALFFIAGWGSAAFQIPQLWTLFVLACVVGVLTGIASLVD